MKFCMYVSLLVGLLPFLNQTNIGISTVSYDYISEFFWKHSLDVCTPLIL